MRLDTFIGENWNDTKAIQREFVNAIVAERKIGTNQEFSKIDQLCSTTAETGCNEKGLPGLQSDSLEKNDESHECQCIDPEEQWNKPRPQKQTKNKGKYLTPSDKRLNLIPVCRQRRQFVKNRKKKKAKI